MQLTFRRRGCYLLYAALLVAITACNHADSEIRAEMKSAFSISAWKEIRISGPNSFEILFDGSPQASGDNDPCGLDYGVEVVETDSEVGVQIVARNPLSVSTAYGCAAIAIERTVSVVLQAPLGKRLIVDKTSGRQYVPSELTTDLRPTVPSTTQVPG